MIRIIGLLTTALIIEIPLILLDWYIGNGFLYTFFQTQSLSVMGTILGLNIAMAAFLIGHLVNLEVSLGKQKMFQGTRREMKQNLYFMILLFVIQLILLIVDPTMDPSLPDISTADKLYGEIFLGINLLVFFLYMYTLFEMTRSLFQVEAIFKEDQQSDS